jgi:importin subunit beta-1
MSVFQQSNPVAEAECFVLFSAVANCAEGNFVRYMQVIEPHLLKALGDAENYHVCCVAIGLVGDISRAIEKQLMNNGLCDKIVKALLELLENENLDRSVKPPVLGAFGDIGLGIGSEVNRYLMPIMSMMVQASQAVYDPNDVDEDTIDFFMEMRQYILETYCGILQGLSDENGSPQPFLPYLQSIFQFFKLIAHDSNSTTKCFVNVSCLIGDIIMCFPNETKTLARQDQQLQQLVNYVFQKCREDGHNLDETEKESVEFGMSQWTSLQQ